MSVLIFGASKNHENKWCSFYLSYKGENQFIKRKSVSFENSLLHGAKTKEEILRSFSTKSVNQRNDSI